ncbi:MAG: DNA-protecting protein DprA [Gammaproteobacteria bacterium]|nr:DNA-protecting protein DprA [Gammaproteobacteria bacterium]
MKEHLDAAQLPYWLALHRAPGVGSVTLRRLVEHYGSPQNVFDNFDASTTSLGKRAMQIEGYLRAPDWAQVDRDLKWLEADDCHITPLGSTQYPELLKRIGDPPALLFVQGNLQLLASPQLAVVGSRNPSRDGIENALNFSRSLSQAGLTITSGLALGIDGAAHRGALERSGHTIAVAGTGLDQIYPKSHKTLAQRIIGNGAMVSELAPGTAPLARNFPRRNRIISGLSLGTLVVEASPGSGSLITAQSAVEENREVFAIPGSIHNPTARGCHALIRQGAKLVESVDDIVEELPPFQLGCSAQMSLPLMLTDGAALEEKHQQILACFGYGPTAIDILIDRSGLTPEEVSSMLTLLELRGYVTPVSGGMYSRNNR